MDGEGKKENMNVRRYVPFGSLRYPGLTIKAGRKVINMTLLSGLSALLSGCHFSYILHSAKGQYRVLADTVPMTKAMANPAMPPADHDKLLWVRQVRSYAQKTVGLKTGRSYLGFYDTRGNPAVWNLSASRKDAFEPYSWTFPIVGKFDYLGYFDKGLAERQARRLEEQGYDTVIYGAAAYSTAGWFPDPFFSSLLRYDKPTLAEIVIHELAHNTVFTKNDSDFTESVANFVGKTGAQEFIKSVAGDNSELYRQALDNAEDQAMLNDFLDRLHQDLNAFYGRKDLSSAEKIAQRDRIFLAHRERFKIEILPRFHRPQAMKTWENLPVNNAQILLNRRYNRQTDLFDKVYRACQGNLNRAVGVFAQAAKSGNAWRHLENWLNNQPHAST